MSALHFFRPRILVLLSETDNSTSPELVTDGCLLTVGIKFQGLSFKQNFRTFAFPHFRTALCPLPTSQTSSFDCSIVRYSAVQISRPTFLSHFLIGLPWFRNSETLVKPQAI